MQHDVFIAPGRRAVFIADLHLQPALDDTYRLALRFLEQLGADDSLFILGDLFEYWIGDDAGLELYKPAVHALKALSDSGCELRVFLGNRDFLLGRDFADASGAVLVSADETVLNLAGANVLLMHGDTLCTDDTDYQAFRQLVRHPDWQKEFLSLSIDDRLEKAERMRSESKAAGGRKKLHIMDVNQSQVVSRMMSHDCSTLVHGHTHRPQLHQMASPASERFVVGDWHVDHAQYVVFDGMRLSMSTFQG